ncbi:hypothetical protein Ddc_03627 [Ditylenchus destructor]|nr:hypothetical protein Ddc_03627 [Ditylenchus destructor]
MTYKFASVIPMPVRRTLNRNMTCLLIAAVICAFISNSVTSGAPVDVMPLSSYSDNIQPEIMGDQFGEPRSSNILINRYMPPGLIHMQSPNQKSKEFLALGSVNSASSSVTSSRGSKLSQVPNPIKMHNLLGGNILVRTTENSDRGNRPKSAAASLWETMDSAEPGQLPTTFRLSQDSFSAAIKKILMGIH